MKRRLLFLTVVLSIMFLIFSCSDKTTGPDDGEDEPIEPIIAEETFVMSRDEAEAIVPVTETTFILPADIDPDAYQAGSVLVAEPTDHFPDGFLRKVVSATRTEDQVTIETEMAKLVDIFEQVEISVSQTMSTRDIEKSTPLLEGVSFYPDSKDWELFSYSIDHTIELGDYVEINIDGGLGLMLGYDFDIETGWTIVPPFKRVEKAHAGANATAAAALNVTVTGEFEYETEIPLYEHRFNIFVYWVGPVPITFRPVITVMLNINAEGEAEMTASASVEATANAGLRYDRGAGGWSSYGERNVETTYSPPSLTASLDIEVSAGPRFDLLIYGYTGTYLYPLGYLNLVADIEEDPWWTLYGGFKMHAGVKFEVLSFEADYCLEDLIDFRRVIVQATPITQVPTPSFHPPGGDYGWEQNVEIRCVNQEATIRYTDDGSDPNEESPEYTEPILVEEDTTLKAIAFHDDLDPSEIGTAVYSFSTPHVATPVFYPSGGTYDFQINVMITCATEGAAIRYTDDGSEPTEDSTPYTGPISISQETTLKARAFREGLYDSEIATAHYEFRMIHIDGGTFEVTDDYIVTVPSFYIGRNQVTQAEYELVMGYNPSQYQAPDNPVDSASWFNAIEYCNRLSILADLTPVYTYGTHGAHPDNWPEGWDQSSSNHDNITADWNASGYRLPTEMQWMFAAIGGNLSQGYTYSGSNHVGEVAWYSANSGGTTNTVGTKLPNELGLYDMSGNVREWCWDRHGSYPSGSHYNPSGPASGGSRVARGGSWYDPDYYCEVGDRNGRDYPLASSHRLPRFGFRVTLPSN